MDNYYDLLGVEKTATLEEIKKAYRAKAIKYHPDRNPDNKEAEEMFKKVTAAYEVLGNEEKRRMYDLTGRTEDSRADYSNTYNSYNNYNTYSTEETFWQWFTDSQNQSSNQEENGQYNRYNWNYNSNNYSNKESYISTFIAKLVQTILGFASLRFSIYFPFGFLICVGVIANGIKGMVRSMRIIKYLGKSEKNK